MTRYTFELLVVEATRSLTFDFIDYFIRLSKVRMAKPVMVYLFAKNGFSGVYLKDIIYQNMLLHKNQCRTLLTAVH